MPECATCGAEAHFGLQREGLEFFCKEHLNAAIVRGRLRGYPMAARKVRVSPTEWVDL